MNVVLRESLLAPHNLTLESMGHSKLSVSDIRTLASLDPLTTTVIEILNDESKWTPMLKAREAGIEVPEDAFVAARIVEGAGARGMGVYDEQFVVLHSSARRAVETFVSLSQTAQSEIGLAITTPRGLRIQYQVADSFAELGKSSE